MSVFPRQTANSSEGRWGPLHRLINAFSAHSWSVFAESSTMPGTVLGAGRTQRTRHSGALGPRRRMVTERCHQVSAYTAAHRTSGAVWGRLPAWLLRLALPGDLPSGAGWTAAGRSISVSRSEPLLSGAQELRTAAPPTACAAGAQGCGPRGPAGRCWHLRPGPSPASCLQGTRGAGVSVSEVLSPHSAAAVLEVAGAGEGV